MKQTLGQKITVYISRMVIAGLERRTWGITCRMLEYQVFLLGQDEVELTVTLYLCTSLKPCFSKLQKKPTVLP